MNQKEELVRDIILRIKREIDSPRTEIADICDLVTAMVVFKRILKNT